MEEAREGQMKAGGQNEMWRWRKEWQERNESGGGGGEGHMETEREEEQRDCAKQGNHERRPSPLQRAEWRLTQIDGPRHYEAGSRAGSREE